MNKLYIGIQPGDIGFTKGGGFVGWLIRHGTASAYAHTFVYHKLIRKFEDGTEEWQTVEAFPKLNPSDDGVCYRIRTEAPSKVIRLWRSQREQQAILDKSHSLVGTRYGWGEITRIALRMVGIKVKGWESNHRMICSNHCTQSALAARPQLKAFFKYQPSDVWPGYLAEVSDGIDWAQDRINDSIRRNK